MNVTRIEFVGLSKEARIKYKELTGKDYQTKIMAMEFNNEAKPVTARLSLVSGCNYYEEIKDRLFKKIGNTDNYVMFMFTNLIYLNECFSWETSAIQDIYDNYN